MSDVKRARCAVESDDPTNVDVFLDDPSLTAGQKHRLSLFHRIESVVCSRVEEMCATGDVDVTDIAVLVVDPSANVLLFGDDQPRGTTILLGHRGEVRAFLNSVLPAADDAPFDPYDDLLAPAPSQSVRVLIMDDHSLTVMSYGTFVTLNVDPDQMAQA